MGKILNSCLNTSCNQNGFCGGVSLLSKVTKFPISSKMSVISLDGQVKAFQVGVFSRNIKYLGNFGAHSPIFIIHTMKKVNSMLQFSTARMRHEPKKIENYFRCIMLDVYYKGFPCKSCCFLSLSLVNTLFKSLSTILYIYKKKLFIAMTTIF